MKNVDTRVGRVYSPVEFTDVTVNDVFWSPRIKVNREATIPVQYKQCKDTGRIDRFDPDWVPGEGQDSHIFHDSDVAKWIEAVSYSLASNPDPELDALLDQVIALIAKTQRPDGYVNSYYTYVEPEGRWTNLRDQHELYCAGHLMEAAVAHYQATGKTSLLDIMCRYADYIDSVFGAEEGKVRGYCGHEEIELALVKLYHATGNERYLKLSKYFVDERGQEPNFFVQEMEKRGKKDDWQPLDYYQAHKPVREQDMVVGHAVRAMYLFSAVADLAAEYGDESLKTTCERVWNNLCLKNLYLTGGIGPSRHNEGFTRDYDLPNETAYCETCAAIGLVFWNHRMLQIDCDSRYADVMERSLYNGVISGVSLDGTRFFYVNPLESAGGHHRKEWFGCACCPPNAARILASFAGYIYSQSDTDAIVHLYVQGEGKLTFGGTTVKLVQQTNYPWEGSVKITVNPDAPSTFGLRMRIPAWCKGASVKVNGEVVDIAANLVKGYARVEREWKAGDVVELDFPMHVERVFANPEVPQDAGKVAIQRGPVVYCLEAVDNPVPPHRIVLPRDAKLEARFDKDMFDGVVVIEADALAVSEAGWEGQLYRTERQELEPCSIKAIPYFTWDNREAGRMAVWLTEGC